MTKNDGREFSKWLKQNRDSKNYIDFGNKSLNTKALSFSKTSGENYRIVLKKLNRNM